MVLVPVSIFAESTTLSIEWRALNSKSGEVSIQRELEQGILACSVLGVPSHLPLCAVPNEAVNVVGPSPLRV